jgi:dTDP-L-rhamnose 4-epimerase
MKRVLVTGGAGFIGSHLVDALVRDGIAVRVFDNLLEQAHPHGMPAHLNRAAEFVLGDIRDKSALSRAIDGIDTVFHLAAMVGNGQSMFDIERYTDVNVRGTATLMEALVTASKRPARLVVSSSMVVYGDGAYACPEHGEVEIERPVARLRERVWEPICARTRCGLEVAPIPTLETHRHRPTSTYGTSKRGGEEVALVLGQAHKLPTIALRYLNTYGSRQALSNPYTGVIAIMGSRIRSGKAPLVFEDGKQLRDFTHVSDIVRANLAAARAPETACYQAYNVGTGQSNAIAQIAQTLCDAMAPGMKPTISEQFREGDIRHCFADVTRAKAQLGWEASVPFKEGIGEFLAWAQRESPQDRSDEANAELRQKGLIW